MSRTVNGWSRTMKVGDLEPPFNPVLYDNATGLPLNLSTATSVKVSAKDATGAAVFTGATASGNAAGQVSRAWAAGDVASARELRCIVLVEWTTGRVQTFPEEGTYVVTIEAV